MENSTISDKLTKEVAVRAFEVAKDAVHFDEGELVLIQEDNYDKAIAFLRSSFVKDESMSKAVDLQWNTKLEEMFNATFQLNISFMLVDPKSGDVMGSCLMSVMKCDDKMDSAEIDEPSFKKMFGFWIYSEGLVNFFDKYKVKEAIHFFGLGVGEKYRRRGIGGKLMEASMSIIENLGISPICVKVEATSNISKKIIDKMNLDVLADVNIDDYVVDGEVVIKATGEHKSRKMYGKLFEF